MPLCCLCGLGIFPWACIKSEISYSPCEDDIKWWSSSRLSWASSSWASQEDHMLEACRPFGDNRHVKMCLMKLSHSGVWGSKSWVFTKQQWSSDALRLDGTWSIVIKIKRVAQGKGMALLGFPFTGLKVVVGRPGYRIDSRTIKRGFRLGNLITSS